VAVNFYVRSLWQVPGRFHKRTLARLPAERTRLQSMQKDQALHQVLTIVSSTRRSVKVLLRNDWRLATNVRFPYSEM